jgi:hypothetical protein
VKSDWFGNNIYTLPILVLDASGLFVGMVLRGFDCQWFGLAMQILLSPELTATRLFNLTFLYTYRKVVWFGNVTWLSPESNCLDILLLEVV